MIRKRKISQRNLINNFKVVRRYTKLYKTGRNKLIILATESNMEK